MVVRLQAQGFHSFLSFYAASKTHPACHARQLSCVSTTTRAPSRRVLRRTPDSSRSPVIKRAFHASAPSYASPKDPYKVLGVAKDASAADLKKVYFSLARKYHPDTNPDKTAREKFQEIQDAYDTLKDDKKRAAYDKYGSAAQQPGFDADAFEQMRQNPFAGGGFGGFGGFGGMGGGFRTAGGSPEDVFSSLFGAAFGGGGRGRSNAPVRGDDLEASVSISFNDACKGTARTVNTTPVTDCHTCTGTGLKAGAKRSTCSTCNGSGTQRFVVDGGFQASTTCGSCGGAGTTVPRGSACSTCDGIGKLRERKSVQMDIPAGAEDGMVFRIAGAGDAPISGKGRSGDLLVRVSVGRSNVFRRQGPNLYHDAKIPLHTAVLGGRVRIPTLDGEVDVRVPTGTQHGEEMVLKKRGIASKLSGYVDQGDLFVSFRIQLPRSLTERQRALFQQYADDVEGRSPATSSEPAEAPAQSKGPSSASSSSDNNDSSVDAQPESDEAETHTPKTKRAAAAS